MDLTQVKVNAPQYALMPLSGELAKSALLPVANAAVGNLELSEGAWELSVLSGTTADTISAVLQPAATAAPAFGALQPVPATLTANLIAFRADQVKRIVVDSNQPKIHIAHSNAAPLSILICRVLA